MKEKIIGDDIEGEYVCDPELVRESIERMTNRELDGEERIDMLMDVTSELPPEMFEDKLGKVGGDNPSFSCVSESATPNKTGVTAKGPPEDLQNLQNSKDAQEGDTVERGVAQQGDMQERGVAQRGDTAERGVAQQPEEDSLGVEGVLISLHDYRRWFARNKSKWSIYREIRSCSFPFPLSFTIIGGHIHYFVEISDPQMIKTIRMNIVIEKKIKPYENKLIQVPIRIPREDLKLVKLIVPGFFHYDHFIKFAESALEEESNFPPIRLYKDKVEFVRTAINLLESDYKKFLQVAENNDRSMSDVVMAFLESYLEAQYRTILDKGSKKGGKDGDILPAGGEAEAQ
jgi:Arc/MetJ-type ribon-helix-helix transcriptional regulator